MATDNGQVESQESLSEVADTTTQDETASQTSSESHDGADNASEASRTGSHEAKEDPIARERQKMSVLESKAAKLERETRDHKGWILQKEHRTRDYFESLGYTPDKVEQFVTTIKQNNPNLWQDPQAAQASGPVQTQYDPGQIAQTVKTEIELGNAQKEFFKASPDFDPTAVSKLSEEDRMAKMVLAEAIENMAFAFAARNGQRVPTTEMYINARDRLISSSALDKAREDGEVEGMARANASRASDFSVTSGSQKSSGAHLTADEREIAAKMKMTPEEYAKYKVE